MRSRPVIGVLLIVLSSIGVAAQTARTPELNRKTFEKIWKTVNDTFYDPAFGGVDWKKAHDDYGPRAVKAVTDEEFYAVVTEMLGLLKVSHLEAGPASAVEKFQKPAAATGLGLRTIEGRVGVLRLIPGFPAEKAGLKPGYFITSIDSVKPKDLDDAVKRLAGAADTTVRIVYLDEKDAEHEATVARQLLSNSDRGNLAGLKVYSLFDAKQLESGIGYISFTSFVPFLNDKIDAAFESMKNAPGIILDLRGNSGGDDSVALRIDNKLFENETQLMLIKTRKGELKDMKAKGSKNAYRGKFVILVDELSGSASEDITAGLQEAGRAYVIGTKTAGRDLDADVTMLPDGGMLVYPFGQTHTPKGFIVEGNGITPNQVVELKRADLLAGRDTQLEAAIKYIQPK